MGSFASQASADMARAPVSSKFGVLEPAGKSPGDELADSRGVERRTPMSSGKDLRVVCTWVTSDKRPPVDECCSILVPALGYIAKTGAALVAAGGGRQGAPGVSAALAHAVGPALGG